MVKNTSVLLELIPNLPFLNPEQYDKDAWSDPIIDDTQLALVPFSTLNHCVWVSSLEIFAQDKVMFSPGRTSNFLWASVTMTNAENSKDMHVQNISKRMAESWFSRTYHLNQRQQL